MSPEENQRLSERLHDLHGQVLHNQFIRNANNLRTSDYIPLPDIDVVAIQAEIEKIRKLLAGG